MTDDTDETTGHAEDVRFAQAVHALRSPVATDEPRFDAAVLHRLRDASGPRRARHTWIAAAALAAALAVVASTRVLDLGHRHTTPATAMTRLVQFRLDGVQATSVAVAGSFNGWNPTATPLHRAANGAWVADVRLRPGRHVYQFVVDRTHWIPDPRSPRDPGDDFGTPNSVITVLPHGSGS